MVVKREGGRLVTNGNGNGRGYRESPLALGIAGMSMLFSLGFSFYTVANPKGDVLIVKQESREDLRRAEDRFEQEIKGLKANSLSISEHREFVVRTDKGLDYLNGEITRIRGDQVSRAEHQQHWNETNDRIGAIRDSVIDVRKTNEAAIGELAKSIGGQYTLGDQLKNLQDQIKLLTARIDSMRRAANPNTQ